MKLLYTLIALAVLAWIAFLAVLPHITQAQSASPWFITGGSSGYIKAVNNTLGLQVPSLNAANCDVKADGSGRFSCGTDASGGAGTGSNWSVVGGTNYLTPSSTIGVIINASSTFNGTLRMGNATSTNFAITSLTSELLKVNGDGTVLEAIAGTDYALTSSAMTGTFDGNNFAGGAIGAGELLYGASAGSLTELAVGTNGHVLALSGGVPTWVATTTLSTITGTLAVAKGGTGLTTFGGTNTLLYTTAADTLSSEAALTYDPAVNRLTASYASTTAVTVSGTASTSKFFADGLTTCNAENMLTWSGGTFGCESDTAGAGGTGSNWSVIGGTSYLAPSSTIGVIVNASSTFNGTLTVAATTTHFNDIKMLNATGDGHQIFFTDDLGSHYLSADDYWIDTVGNATEVARWLNGTTELMRIGGNGNLGIGTTTPSGKLGVQGNIWTNGNITAANFIATGTIKLVGGTAVIVNEPGEIDFDTTSNNLVMATSTNSTSVVIASATTTLYAFTASTSPIVSGSVLDLPSHFLAQNATGVICKVSSGTSLVINISNAAGSADSNTVTCTTTETQFAFTSGNTFAAYAAPRLEFGTKTGDTGNITIRIIGYRKTD